MTGGTLYTFAVGAINSVAQGTTGTSSATTLYNTTTVTYTSNGTYYPPSGTVKMAATMVGGGQGGLSGSTLTGPTPRNGELTNISIRNVTSSTPLTVTIGYGGQCGAGGTVWFGQYGLNYSWWNYVDIANVSASIIGCIGQPSSINIGGTLITNQATSCNSDGSNSSATGTITVGSNVYGLHGTSGSGKYNSGTAIATRTAGFNGAVQITYYTS